MLQGLFESQRRGVLADRHRVAASPPPMQLVAETGLIGRRDEPATSSLADYLTDESRLDVRLDTVPQSPARCRHGYGIEARTISVADVGKVEYEAPGYAESPAAPARRKGQVDPTRKDIREIVERERPSDVKRLLLLAPQPEDHEILVVGGSKVDEAVNPPPHALDLLPSVVGEELQGAAGSSCLLRREVARLRLCHVEQGVPFRRFRCSLSPSHPAQT